MILVVDYLSTLPTNTLVNGDKVEIYRRISNSLANKRYLSDKTTYPYARESKNRHIRQLIFFE
jgi:hypothetical protein